MKFSWGRGYTLVELTLVVLLLGILAAVVAPNFIDFRSEAKTAATQTELAALKVAITGDARAVSGGVYTNPGFLTDFGRLPAALSELVINPNTGNTTQDYDPLTRKGWRGPYVDPSTASDYTKDAWGTAYVYSSASRYIRSWGPNKVDNAGAGDDIEISF